MVIHSSGHPSYTLDLKEPDQLLVPSSEEECVRLVEEARRNGDVLIPAGGGTALSHGNLLPASRLVVVSTAGMANMAEYSPDDMVVTAGAGMTLANIQNELARHGQFLPIDPPRQESATLGGIVATDAAGLWRPAYGTPRDRLLGVRVVLSNGSVVRGGGKVVKNVAGYDLCKLFAGSWGTLGIITEVTFKTNPLPPVRAHVCFICFNGKGIAESVAAALEVHRARLQPVYLMVSSNRSDEPSIAYGLHGSEKAVAWQREAAAAVLGESGLKESAAGLSENDLRELIAVSPAPAKIRITVRPTDLADVCERLAVYSDALACNVPNGIIDVALALSVDSTESEFASIRREIANIVGSKGHIVWTAVPPEWKKDMDVWGTPRGDFALMRGVKHALDPLGLFSPGRFLGRL